MLDYVAIGRKIKMYRKEANLTQAKLAEKLNMSDKYLSSLELGKEKISLTRLDEIAVLLKIEVIDLLSGTDSLSTKYGNTEILELIKDWDSEEKTVLIKLINTFNEHKKQK